MKHLAKSFGFDAMLGGSVRKRIARLRAGDAPKDESLAKSAGNPMMMHVVVKELSRVSPGFAMGFGVSMGLVGGAISMALGEYVSVNPNMSCGHCETAVRSEVGNVAGVAGVVVDLDAKLVTVTGTGIDRHAVVAAIDEAGYEVAAS